MNLFEYLRNKGFFVLDKFKNNPVELFFVAIIVFSIFEYAIGYGLDALYNLWLWDYRNEFLNIVENQTL